MRCQFPDCITISGEINKDKLCRLHTRILFQHDILYERGRFYRIIKAKIKVRNKKGKMISRIRDKKEFIPIDIIEKLKEAVNIIDVFSEDRIDIGFAYAPRQKNKGGD